MGGEGGALLPSILKKPSPRGRSGEMKGAIVFANVLTAALAVAQAVGFTYLFFMGRPVSIPLLCLSCVTALAASFMLGRETAKRKMS